MAIAAHPDDIEFLMAGTLLRLLPGDLTRTTVTEIFATSNQPQQHDMLHERLRIEDESGTIWQEGCGDQRESESGATGIFLDLVGWERDFETWERANRRWIEQWRGREAQLGRSPAPRLDARLAPTQTFTPGEFPTSTPTPSSTTSLVS